MVGVCEMGWNLPRGSCLAQFVPATKVTGCENGVSFIGGFQSSRRSVAFRINCSLNNVTMCL